jgi:uncharacterized protein (TIGR03790 family)
MELDSRSVLMLLFGLVGAFDDMPVQAIEPTEVLIVANQLMAESMDVARHYCRRRNIPVDNIVSLNLPLGEEMTRQQFDTQLREPLREHLRKRARLPKVLLCVYGVPLRVGGIEYTEAEKAAVAKLQNDISKAQQRLATAVKEVNELQQQGGPALQIARDKLKKAQAEIAELRRQEKRLLNMSQAAVDNELMLILWDDYELKLYQPNPLHFRAPERLREGRPPVMMTARLDGPTPAIAKRLVDDAVEVEAVGLKGKVYLDARGLKYDAKKDDGYNYAAYDESFREAARLLKDTAKMDVVLDDQPETFPPHFGNECCLYAGWYSHAKFVDSLNFVKGAVAWHLASSEAVSLRRPSGQWCQNLLKKGVIATLGPVAEPFTVGFPKPAEFFGFLATGQFTLVECYARTLNLTSWMCTLIGDPLYNPFKSSRKLKQSDVFASPRGSRFLVQ